MADVSDGFPVEMSLAMPDGVSFMHDPDALAIVNPFGNRDAAVVDLNKEVSLSQLADEISTRTGIKTELVLTQPRPSSAFRSPRLHMCPPVDEETLREVIAAHEPDQDYGLSDDQRERVDLLKRLREGKKMTQEELQRALVLSLSANR